MRRSFLYRRKLLLGLVAAIASTMLPPSSNAEPDGSPVGPSTAARIAETFPFLTYSNAAKLLLPPADDKPPTFVFVYHLPAGDLDGDSLSDVVGLEYGFTELTATAASGTLTLRTFGGRRGNLLWKHQQEFKNGFATALETKLGPKGKTGYIILTDGSSGSGRRLLITAINDRGRKLWEQNVSAEAYENLVGLGFLNALPGKSVDTLLAISQATSLGAATLNESRATIIDGGTGDASTHSVGETSSREKPVAAVAPDLSGDGLEDYVTLSSGLDGSGQLTARRGTDGVAVWVGSAVTYQPMIFASNLGDATGGGTPDFVLTTSPSQGVAPGAARVYLIEAESGNVIWSGGQNYTFPNGYALGKVDKGRQPDLGVFGRVQSADRAEVRFEARDGTGKKLYESTYSYSGERSANSQPYASFSAAGDLDGDGSPDTRVTLGYQSNDPTGGSQYEVFFVSGRTGKKLYGDSLHDPILAAVDGRGDDLWTYYETLGKVWFDVVAGDKRNLLWKVNIQGPTEQGAIATVAGGRLDRDRCGEVLVTITNLSWSEWHVLVLRGKNGAKLWSRNAQGGKDNLSVSPTKRSRFGC